MGVQVENCWDTHLFNHLRGWGHGDGDTAGMGAWGWGHGVEIGTLWG